MQTAPDKFFGFLPQYDPHGDPIPKANGETAVTYKTLLAEMTEGKNCQVVAVKDTSPSFLQYLKKLDIGIGTKITLLEKITFDNPVADHCIRKNAEGNSFQDIRGATCWCTSSQRFNIGENTGHKRASLYFSTNRCLYGIGFIFSRFYQYHQFDTPRSNASFSPVLFRPNELIRHREAYFICSAHAVIGNGIVYLEFVEVDAQPEREAGKSRIGSQCQFLALQVVVREGDGTLLA